MSWQDLAVCRHVDPELFFPPHSGSTGRVHYGAEARKQIEEAKKVCQTCPVTAPCLDLAVWLSLRAGGVEGVWAGRHFPPYSTRSRIQHILEAGA